uniref:Uncharacterized protein n=1 Tax=Anguilla anguilla TaxID=7936 RepID=A0A0E9U4Q6_ANGAN
MAPPTRSCT